MWSVWLVFCDCGFHSVCPLRDRDKRFMEASYWERMEASCLERLTGGGTWVVFWWVGHVSKSLVQFSVDGQDCVPSLLFAPPNYGGGNEDNGDFLQKAPGPPCCTQCPPPCSRLPPTHTSTRDSWTLTGMSGSVSYGVIGLNGYWFITLQVKNFWTGGG